MAEEEKKEEPHEHKEHEHHDHQEKKEENHEHAHEHPEHHENHEKEHASEHHEHHEKKEEEKHHEPPSGEKKDLRDSRISILVFTLAGAAVGLLSSVLKSSGISSWITGAIGIILLIVLAFGMIKMFRKKLKFFYAGLFIYLLIWLIVWIFLFNV